MFEGNDFVQNQNNETDVTKITINPNNKNYEKSKTAKIDGKVIRGYKLGTIRGIFQDSGIMEEVILGRLKTHDMQLFRVMLKSSLHFKASDTLINDRGFISRDMINYFKPKRRKKM